MKGYKDSTKTQWLTGKSPGAKGAAKVATVMREFKSGSLHSGSKSGPKVTKPAQAKAIAMSEAKKVKGYAEGGEVKIMARGDIEPYNDKSTMKYRREGPGWRMDEEEFRVSGEIDARDRSDIEKGRGPKASKLDKMAAEEAVERQNRRGWATDGFNADTGIGLQNPTRRFQGQKGTGRVYRARSREPMIKD